MPTEILEQIIGEALPSRIIFERTMEYNILIDEHVLLREGWVIPWPPLIRMVSKTFRDVATPIFRRRVVILKSYVKDEF